MNKREEISLDNNVSNDINELINNQKYERLKKDRNNKIFRIIIVFILIVLFGSILIFAYQFIIKNSKNNLIIGNNNNNGSLNNNTSGNNTVNDLNSGNANNLINDSDINKSSNKTKLTSSGGGGGGGGSGGGSGTTTPIISDDIYPIFSNLTDNNASLINLGIARFNVSILNTNGSVYLNVNGQNYSASNLTANNYNVSLSLDSSGSYDYYWYSYGNGTQHNYNTSLTRNYIVNSSMTDCYNGADAPIITICTCDDLNKTRDNLTANYILENDINFSNCDPTYTTGEGWISIPTYISGSFGFPVDFNGSFDGNNHTIYNLFINITNQNHLITYDYHGLFSILNGEIKNLNIDNAQILITNRGDNGAIAGYNIGNITNCKISDSLISGSSYIGGVTGYSEGIIENINITNSTIKNSGSLTGGIVGKNIGNISNSSVYYSIMNGTTYTGGIVGSNIGNITNTFISLINITGSNYVGSIAGTSDKEINNLNLSNINIKGANYVGGILGLGIKNITNCQVSGNIQGNNYVGGIVGWFGNTTVTNISLNIVISDSLSYMNITGGNYVGGIVGYNKETIINSSSYGNISAINQVGGLIGYNSNFGMINNSNSNENITGNLNVGGFIGENHGMITDSFSKYNISATLNYIGGFVGLNNGTISSSYSEGILRSTGTTGVGGFAGKNIRNLTNCYSKANIIFNNDNSGGLVGLNNGTIDNCYSAGNVTAYGYAGGLVGTNYDNGYIRNSFTTSFVNISAGSFPFNWTVDGDGLYIKVCWGEICYQGNLLGYNTAQTNNHIINSFAYNSSIYPECVGLGFNGGCNQISNISYFFTTTNSPMGNWSFPPWSRVNDGVDYPEFQ